MRKYFAVVFFMLATSVVWAEAPRSDYARDMVEGPVKSIILNGERWRTYTPEGKEINERNEGSTFEGNTRRDDLWGDWPTYTFDDRGRVINISHTMGQETFKYKGKDFLPYWQRSETLLEEYSDDTTVEEGEIKYIKKDKQGNWIERVFAGRTDKRVIEYWTPAEIKAAEKGKRVDPFDGVEQAMAKRNSVKNKDPWWMNALAVTILAIFALGLVHMLRVVFDGAGETRYFTGSKTRLVLFFALMMTVVFFSEGFWETARGVFVAVTTTVFSYLAYLTPSSRLLKAGAPKKNALQVLSGMWGDVESRKTDKARIKAYEDYIESARGRLNSESLSEIDAQRLRNNINEANRNINEEKYHTDEKVALTIVSVLVGVIFVWFTPFDAIFKYFRNYPLHRRKANKGEK